MEHGERHQNHRGNACKINDTDPVAVALALCYSALLVVDKCAQNEIKFKLKWDQIHSNLSCSKLLETKQNEDKSTEKRRRRRRGEKCGESMHLSRQVITLVHFENVVILIT